MISLYRLIIRLTLRRKNELYYISQQEDFYHPEVRLSYRFTLPSHHFYLCIPFTQDFSALLLPASAPFIRFGLTVGGVVSNILARGANALGYWRPLAEPEREALSHAPSESGLYDKDD